MQESYTHTVTTQETAPGLFARPTNYMVTHRANTYT